MLSSLSDAARLVFHLYLWCSTVGSVWSDLSMVGNFGRRKFIFRTQSELQRRIVVIVGDVCAGTWTAWSDLRQGHLPARHRRLPNPMTLTP